MPLGTRSVLSAAYGLVLAAVSVASCAAATNGARSSARAEAASSAQSPPASRWVSTLDVDHPLVGTLWDVAARRPVSEADLLERVRSAPIVAIGETHDNPDHHRLEAELIDAFASRHPAPAVVFEMLEHANQSAVDASLQAHPGDADVLAQAVDWDSSGWPSWSIYRPVFQAAVSARGRLLAAGLDHASAMHIAQRGLAAFEAGLETAFALDAPLPPEQDAAVRREMADSHCGLLPDSMLDAMVLVQRVRDALLAARVHEGAAGGRGAVLIAGDGHVRRDRGVPSVLTRVDATPVLAVGLLEVRHGDTAAEAYAQGFDASALPFDYVWFTPRVSDEDHCAELRARMKVQGRP